MRVGAGSRRSMPRCASSRAAAHRAVRPGRCRPRPSRAIWKRARSAAGSGCRGARGLLDGTAGVAHRRTGARARARRRARTVSAACRAGGGPGAQRGRAATRSGCRAARTPPGRPDISCPCCRRTGSLAPAALLVALLLAAAGVVVEALLFRSLLDLGAHLSLTGQRLATMAAIACLSAFLLLLEVPVATMALGLGRRLETRLRVAFLRKDPASPRSLLPEPPISDMAERAHSAHQIRELPNLGAQFAGDARAHPDNGRHRPALSRRRAHRRGRDRPPW